MGTNYYICKQKYNRFVRWLLNKDCFEYKIHIGKSSSGWCFALHVTNEIKSLDDWKIKLKNLNKNEAIYDEYGTRISFNEMINIIVNRKYFLQNNEISIFVTRNPPYGYQSWEKFHRINNSEFGPNGLFRSKIDGCHCVGHGDGTWDLIAGNFV